MILCAAVEHVNGSILSYSSWATRGWCRLELMARQLKREDGYIITVQAPKNPSLAWNYVGAGQAPGQGSFSFEEDKIEVGGVVLEMLWRKLQQLLERQEVLKFRFLLNIHQKYLEGLGLAPIESLVPGFGTEINPVERPESFLVARFLHENLFKDVVERDAAGWTPLCYAAIKGDPFLVSALLRSRADANDRITRKTHDLPKNCPVLSVAAAYQNNEVMQVLLAAQAKVSARCGYRGTALHWAASSGNVSGIRMLLEHKGDLSLRCLPGSSALKSACAQNRVAAIRELLKHGMSIRYCLHTALLFFGDASTVSCLVEASADVNEQLKVPACKTGWWALLKVLRLQHHLKPSALTYLAYHHHNATPLMFSILTGKYDAAALLLEAGARWELRNGRGKTASDFLREMDASIPVRADRLIAVDL